MYDRPKMNFTCRGFWKISYYNTYTDHWHR